MTVIWAYTLNRVLVVFPKNDIKLFPNGYGCQIWYNLFQVCTGSVLIPSGFVHIWCLCLSHCSILTVIPFGSPAAPFVLLRELLQSTSACMGIQRSWTIGFDDCWLYKNSLGSHSEEWFLDYVLSSLQVKSIFLCGCSWWSCLQFFLHRLPPRLLDLLHQVSICFDIMWYPWNRWSAATSPNGCSCWILINPEFVSLMLRDLHRYLGFGSDHELGLLMLVLTCFGWYRKHKFWILIVHLVDDLVLDLVCDWVLDLVWFVSELGLVFTKLGFGLDRST